MGCPYAEAATNRLTKTAPRPGTLDGMTSLERGLYEVLVTEALEKQLGGLDIALEPIRTALRAPEAADRIALHLARVIERAVNGIAEGERANVGLDLARRLIDLIRELPAAAEFGAERPVAAGDVLQSVAGRLPDGRPDTVAAPMIPLLDTTLLTNAPGEPRVGNQILTEIRSADAIDVVMAFIRYSGIAPLLEALRRHRRDGRKLRVLTTTYTGSTEARALDALGSLGADIRVSYDMHREHVDKSDVLVVDYVDLSVPMLARMATKRQAGYRNLGYVVDAVPLSARELPTRKGCAL